MKVQKAGSDVVCNICARNGAECEIPREKVTVRCAGIRTVCRECVQQHIRASTLKSLTIRCICVEGGCSSQFTHAEVRKHATAEDFTRYCDERLLFNLLAEDPEFCWCAFPGCGSGQLHVGQNSTPIVRCYACNNKTCFHHHCVWHSGRSCEQYDKDAQQSEEVALLQLLENRKILQRCPKCKHGVEKSHGCDHMTCRCKHEFCWRCLAPYGGKSGIRQAGNRAHKKTCRHYRK